MSEPTVESRAPLLDPRNNRDARLPSLRRDIVNRLASTLPTESDAVRLLAEYDDRRTRVTAQPPSGDAPLDVDAQFAALDRSLLMTFQWSDKEHIRQGLAAHGLLQRLHEIGWDVTVRDPEIARAYAEDPA